MEIAWDSPLRGSERLVLLALAWRASEGTTETCKPISDLSRLAGLSADQTRRIVHGLAQAGVIRCAHPGGGRAPATYELIHTPLHSYATPATPGTAMPEHPLHLDASAPLAQLCKPLKEKKKNSPSARVRAPVGGLAIDQHGITHRPGDDRDAEALRQIAQHAPQAVAAAVAAAAQSDHLGRAFPSKVLRLLTQTTPRQSGATPAWAQCADWLN